MRNLEIARLTGFSLSFLTGLFLLGDMRTPGVVLLSVVAFVALILFLRRKGKNGASKNEGFFIAAGSQSEARAASLLPMTASEDRRDLLKVPELPVAPDSDGNYRPDPKVNWVVDVTFAKPQRIENAVLLGGFDNKWMGKIGRPEIYGKGAEDGRWTFVRAGGSPDHYTELAFAWRLLDDSEDSVKPVTAPDLAAYLKKLNERVSVLGDAELKPSASPESAADAAHGLAELKSGCDRRAIVVLKAPANALFEGRKIWDVMMALGLKWGDMDLFHWVNDSDTGDDSFFRVWTSTAPGYFLPEEIAADRLRTADLVFGFSIPRSAAPRPVFASMLKAAQYARQRLGGELVDRNGSSLEVSATEQEIDAVEQRLSAAGFTPGRAARYMFFEWKGRRSESG
jgi:cell division protein ZipA